MGGTEGDPTGRGPMSEMWSTTATAIHTGASAYRKAVDPSSFARKRCVSSAMAATLLEHTPCRSRVHAPGITLKGVVPDRGHDEQRGETRVGVRLGLAPVQEARAILVERLEYVVRKVDHGGLLCHTRACTARGGSRGQAHRVGDDADSSRRALLT